ncbi:hypothetical protein, partial [Candidatus Methylacidiphilum fumarolicum]
MGKKRKTGTLTFSCHTDLSFLKLEAYESKRSLYPSEFRDFSSFYPLWRPVLQPEPWAWLVV